MPNLTVPPNQALSQLRRIPHETCQNGIVRHWRVNTHGHVKAQSACWLYCWAKTGMGSHDAAMAAQQIFDSILDITFNEFDARVPHGWARSARYGTGDIEGQLNAYLNPVQMPPLVRWSVRDMIHERERRGPTGAIELSYVHSESGSEHWDEYETVRLEAKEDRLVLVESTRTTNALRGSQDTKTDEYAIPVRDLIDFIKAKGKNL